MTVPHAGPFSGSLAWLTEPAIARLRADLAGIAGIADTERRVLADSVGTVLAEVAHRRACRVLVLELHTARIGGKLTAADPASRWDEFLSQSEQPAFWTALAEQYPPMLPWLREQLAARCQATSAMALRLAVDRNALAALLGQPPGELTAASIGAGDTHRGGHSVAVLSFEAGPVVYKPRSVAVDTALSKLLPLILSCVPAQERIRVPTVIDRGGHGWAEHVSQRYCTNSAELSAFYTGIGHWLAIMRLLGGTDLHAENVIACGPVPVVVDCEALFTPAWPYPATRFGQAHDRARDLIAATVLRTGMLPVRGAALGWRGVDVSAVGALPGQQPAGQVPVLVDVGTDLARIGFEPGVPEIGASHPSPDPVLAKYWDRIVTGYGEATAILRTLDAAGELAGPLSTFADCPVRMVLRSTEAYSELSRMLWHPVSLRDPAAAHARAAKVLAGMARHVPSAPDDPDVIEAELADLRYGDVPFFGTTPGHGQLTGPGGLTWLPEQDLVAQALTRWRQADDDLEQYIISGTLINAYLNDGWLPRQRPLPTGRRRLANLDRRRRSLAAAVIGQLDAAAFRGQDGTVTWIAPVFGSTGWALQPLNLNTYGGLHGVAVLLAAYEREVAVGRADPVSGAAALLAATLRTIRIAEDEGDRLRANGVRSRPLAPGGYSGLASQVWSWLTLHGWSAAGDDGIARACAIAAQLPASVAADEHHDVLTGMAGAIVPLLALADVTGDKQWLAQAVGIGDRLAGAAIRSDGTCRWPSPLWPDGIGGFAHGATGIGWALARLTLASGEQRFADTARAAFRYEETLYDHVFGGWLDLRREEPTITAAWCHGSVGIGLAAADLAIRGWVANEDLVPLATEVTGRHELLWNHSLCHGDLGAWELADVAVRSGCAPASTDRQRLDARIIGSIECNGTVSGLQRDTFTPCLLHGVGGVGYQLLRMHQDSDLPSVLTLASLP